MIVSISSINGIKQYEIPDNSKKIIILFFVFLVFLLASLVWYIVYLRHDIQAKESHIRGYSILHQSKTRESEQSLSDAQKSYKEFRQKSNKAQNSMRLEIAELKRENSRILKMLKQANEHLEQKNKEVSDLKIKLSKAYSGRSLRDGSANASLSQRRTPEHPEHPEEHRSAKDDLSKKIKLIPKIAKEKLGHRYVWGATGPSVFDCSGFTSYVYRKIGINLPRTSRQQARFGKLVGREYLKPGDLIFFDTAFHRKGIDHVGIYIGDQKFIHASSARKKVIITSLKKAFYSQRFRLARRVN